MCIRDSNGAGVALVLEAGKGLIQFDHRRTVALCFWSNEENGYDGVDRWIENIPQGVTISNYLNADAVGTNWPGYYTLVVDCIPNDEDKIGDQWEMIRMLEWVGVQNNDISDALQLGREIFHEEGYASMKDVIPRTRSGSPSQSTTATEGGPTTRGSRTSSGW